VADPKLDRGPPRAVRFEPGEPAEAAASVGLLPADLLLLRESLGDLSKTGRLSQALGREPAPGSDLRVETRRLGPEEVGPLEERVQGPATALGLLRPLRQRSAGRDLGGHGSPDARGGRGLLIGELDPSGWEGVSAAGQEEGLDPRGAGPRPLDEVVPAQDQAAVHERLQERPSHEARQARTQAGVTDREGHVGRDRLPEPGRLDVKRDLTARERRLAIGEADLDLERVLLADQDRRLEEEALAGHDIHEARSAIARLAEERRAPLDGLAGREAGLVSEVGFEALELLSLPDANGDPKLPVLPLEAEGGRVARIPGQGEGRFMVML